MLLLSFFFLNQQRARQEPATTAMTVGEAEGSKGRNGAKRSTIEEDHKENQE